MIRHYTKDGDILYYTPAGDMIEQAAEKIVSLANGHNLKAQTDFNAIILTARPGDQAEDIVSSYNWRSTARMMSYFRSIGYIPKDGSIE